MRDGLDDQEIAAYLSEYPESSKHMNGTYSYNGLRLSEKIALYRTLPDMPGTVKSYGNRYNNRANLFSIYRCINEVYARKLPNVSVIIVFHSEHLKTLLRTCYTEVRRSPAELLTEIILVDDASTIEDSTKESLESTIEQQLPNVRVIRLEERSGVMKAQVIGAKMAQSKVLVFLDAHCEVYHNWLPPLLGL